MLIRERVDRILREQLGDLMDWGPQTMLVEDLGLDSLDLVQLTVNLEDEFGHRIPDDDEGCFTDVESVAVLIERLAANQPLMWAR